MSEYGVKEYFNLSEKYWEQRGVAVPFVERIEEQFVKEKIRFNESDIVLDFACGLGRWSGAIHKKVKKVIAIDIVPKLIKHVKDKKLRNVHAFVGSDYLLKQYSNHFDKIIFAQALEFYKLPTVLLKLFHKSLKLNGQLFLSTWATQILSGIAIKNDFVVVRRPSDKKFIKVFFKPRNAAEIKTLLKKAGFRKVDVRVLKSAIKNLPPKIKKDFLNKNPEKLLDVLIVAKAIK